MSYTIISSGATDVGRGAAMTEQTSSNRPLASAWDDAKSASIDWSNPADVLANCFTFLQLLRMHDELASYMADHLPEKRECAALFNSAAQHVEQVTALLQSWHTRGLLTMREARWCRYCGRCGHTRLSCPDRTHTAQVTQEPYTSQTRVACAEHNRRSSDTSGAAHYDRSCRNNNINHINSNTNSNCDNTNSNNRNNSSSIDVKNEQENEEDDSHHPHRTICSRTGLTCSKELESEGTDNSAPSTVLEKYRAHMLRLERAKLLASRTSKPYTANVNNKNYFSHNSGNTKNNSNSNYGFSLVTVKKEGNTAGGAEVDDADTSLFSEERRRGVVSRVDVQYGIGFVRLPELGEIKFFLDRADFGVKEVMVGERVTLRVDPTRDYPFAVDVRPERPAVKLADVWAFLTRCSTATQPIRLLAMLLTHSHEWHEVLRWLCASFDEGSGIRPTSTGSARNHGRISGNSYDTKGVGDDESTTAVCESAADAVYTLIALVTFVDNREPVHLPMLTAFLQLTRMPIPALQHSALAEEKQSLTRVADPGQSRGHVTATCTDVDADGTYSSSSTSISSSSVRRGNTIDAASKQSVMPNTTTTTTTAGAAAAAALEACAGRAFFPHMILSALDADCTGAHAENALNKHDAGTASNRARSTMHTPHSTSNQLSSRTTIVKQANDSRSSDNPNDPYHNDHPANANDRSRHAGVYEQRDKEEDVNTMRVHRWLEVVNYLVLLRQYTDVGVSALRPVLARLQQLLSRLLDDAGGVASVEPALRHYAALAQSRMNYIAGTTAQASAASSGRKHDRHVCHLDHGATNRIKNANDTFHCHGRNDESSETKSCIRVATVHDNDHDTSIATNDNDVDADTAGYSTAEHSKNGGDVDNMTAGRTLGCAAHTSSSSSSSAGGGGCEEEESDDDNNSAWMMPLIPRDAEITQPMPHPRSIFTPANLPVTYCTTYSSVEAYIAGQCQMLRADAFEATSRVLTATCFALPGSRPHDVPSANTLADVEHARVYDRVCLRARAITKDRDYAKPASLLVSLQPRSPRARAQWKQGIRPGTTVCVSTALDRHSVQPSELFWAVVSSSNRVLQECGIVVLARCEGGAPLELLSQRLRRNERIGRTEDSVLLETPLFMSGYAAIVKALYAFQGPLAMRVPFIEYILPTTDTVHEKASDRKDDNMDSPTATANNSSKTKNNNTDGPDGMDSSSSNANDRGNSGKCNGCTDHRNNPNECNRMSRLVGGTTSSRHPRTSAMIPPHCLAAFDSLTLDIRRRFALDAGQERVMRALSMAEIMLVQGPPGTGKSFIGCRVVETHVRYKQLIASGHVMQTMSVEQLKSTPAQQLLPRLGPVVVITYKNHALDEFLSDLLTANLWSTSPDNRATATGGNNTSANNMEHLVSSSSGAQEVFPHGCRLVRVGGRSRESRLSEFNLASLMRSKTDKMAIGHLRERLYVLHQRLDRLMKEIAYLESGRVPRTYFERWLTPEQRTHLRYDDREAWLAGRRYTGVVDPAHVPESNYYLTLLRTQIATALRGREGQCEGANTASSKTTMGSGSCSDSNINHNGGCGAAAASSAATVDITGAASNSDRGSSTAAGPADTIRATNLDNMDGTLAAEAEDEDVSPSVFQAMKHEDENWDVNDTLHTLHLSVEALHLAQNPPTLPAHVPSTATQPLQSLWSLDPMTRHTYYAYLIRCCIAGKARDCVKIMDAMERVVQIRNHAIDEAKLSLLREADVVGLTTTGCALNQNLLRSLRPSVLVVEEAAEVLESQVLACMTDSLQQMILIGDHFQLQPRIDTFEYEKYNHMNVSLFERLARTGQQVIGLTEQRRMHPEIASLVSPFYRPMRLLNHPSVYPSHRGLLTARGRLCGEGVPGLAQRVFFWRHNCPEEEAPRSRSKVNRAELCMARRLVAHLVQQGVLQQSITVITPYLGQCRVLRGVLAMSHLNEVRVSTVDLFQGDENDVIVLSLVRTQRLTEFMQLRSRLIVSCSRARFAMVMMGNDALVEQCEHWAQVLSELRERGAVGEELPITRIADPPGAVSYLPATDAVEEAKLWNSIV